MIPLAVPNLSGNEVRYLQECIETNFVSTVGPFVDRFEESVALLSGSVDAVATSSGTSALHLALVASGVGVGDLVVLPTYTFVATASAVAQTGAKGWLLDIDLESLTLDLDQVREAISRDCIRTASGLIHRRSQSRVKAIVPVYTNGNVPDMQGFRALAQEYDLALVADAAAALGADCGGLALGSVCPLSIASFNGNKTFTSGSGGAIFGYDQTLLDRARHLGSTARRGRDYHHDAVGFNYRMSNLQAAVGCAQLEKFEELVQRKREISAFYDRLVAGMAGVSGIPGGSFGLSTRWMAGIVVQDPTRLTAVRMSLEQRGIETRAFWKPIHLQPPYQSWVRDSVARSEWLWPRVLTLPCSTSLADKDLELVGRTLIEAMQ